MSDNSTGAAKGPITQTMRAAVITAPRSLGFVDMPVPVPGPAEVLVRLEGCGVCASNIPVWEGKPWFAYPLAPGAGGHEGWGRIEAAGRDVKTLWEGDRVSLISYNAYAEYDMAPADLVVRLPSKLDGKPFPGEALGCAVNVFRRSDIQPGQTVAIVGIGFLGALLTRLVSWKGARVIAISRRQFALDVARGFGADTAIAMDDHTRIVEEVNDLTNGRGCDRVIEAIGKQWPLDLASELTAERGRLVIAGYHQDGPRHVNMQLWNWRGIDVVNAHERDPKLYVEGMRAAIEAITSGILDPTPLYTHAFPLNRLRDAFETAIERPDGFMKATVTMV